MFSDLDAINPAKYARRSVLKMTRDEFAEAMNVSVNTIGYWERIKGQIPEHRWSDVRAVAEAKGVEWRDEWFLHSGIPVVDAAHGSDGHEAPPPQKGLEPNLEVVRMCALIVRYPDAARAALDEIEAIDEAEGANGVPDNQSEDAA